VRSRHGQHRAPATRLYRRPAPERREIPCRSARRSSGSRSSSASSPSSSARRVSLAPCRRPRDQALAPSARGRHCRHRRCLQEGRPRVRQRRCRVRSRGLRSAGRGHGAGRQQGDLPRHPRPGRQRPALPDLPGPGAARKPAGVRAGDERRQHRRCSERRRGGGPGPVRDLPGGHPRPDGPRCGRDRRIASAVAAATR
jgi:translation initiation factor IF-2